jgi:hypothetical protein
MVNSNISRGSRAFTLLVASLFLCQMFTGVMSKTAGYDKLSETCKEKLFPITSGGSKDEKVSCTLNFEQHGLIIVAGNTTSGDYAPAPSDHAFVYAVDYEGNWQWGNFYYNVSFAIADISGCHIDKNGNAVMLGMGNSVPLIMELNPKNGEVLNFMSLDKIGYDDPKFKTFGAIYHDIKDVNDG